jgi:DNA-directed RNA polymerase subunit RPC12/RpoP
VFACEHCGKEFDNEKSCKMHSIRCPERKGEE